MASGGMPYLLNQPAQAGSPSSLISAPLSPPPRLLSPNGAGAGRLQLAPRRSGHHSTQGNLCPRACLTAAFGTLVWTSRNAPSTRSENWTIWSTAVSWGVACIAGHTLLPMSTSTLMALTTDLLGLFMPRAESVSAARPLQSAALFSVQLVPMQSSAFRITHPGLLGHVPFSVPAQYRACTEKGTYCGKEERTHHSCAMEGSVTCYTKGRPVRTQGKLNLGARAAERLYRKRDKVYKGGDVLLYRIYH